MKKLLLLILFAIPSFTPAMAQKADTTRIYFAIDQHDLTPAHLVVLDSLKRVLSTNARFRLSLIGYTDYLGNTAYNLDLSERRVASVTAYFGQSRINNMQIVSAKGKGQVTASQKKDGGNGVPEHRRVDIILETEPRQKQKTETSDIPAVSELKAGESFILKQLTFLPGRHVIHPEARPELERLLKIMFENPSLEIEIQGHICCESSSDGLDVDTGERNLSETRAKYVYDYLVSNGIEPSRMKHKGYARRKPLLRVERTEEDRQRNRRVEIKILKK